jgi:hypothetical protein
LRYFADNPCHRSKEEEGTYIFLMKQVPVIESEIARKINFDNVITRFALKKARKAPLNAIVK